MCGAPHHPVPVNLRGAALAPIKMARFASKPATADATDDGGSSSSSTPSSACSLETTPSPLGPLPPPAHLPASYAALLLSQAQAQAQQLVMMPPPPRPFPAPATVSAAPRGVEVRQVWAHNFHREAALIESLLPAFPYVAVDTEFPGTVYRPAGPAYMLTPEKRYALLKANVDELELIQLGLTLFDYSGRRLPGAGSGVWEFNFREFDVRRHSQAPESVAMLRTKGVDFDRARRHGVDAAAFGPRLRKWLRAGLGRAGVVTFSGGYDLAYLVKTMFGAGYKLPASAEEFEGVARALLRRKLFDVKEMARHCPSDLRGGLEIVAGKLSVARAVGEAHQAGSDSLLTCQTFMKMRERYFDDDDKLAKVAGILTGVTA